MEYTYLSFNSQFKSQLIEGSKTQTLRFDLEEIPTEGEVKDAMLDTGEYIGDIKITEVSQLTVTEVADRDFSGHTNYSNPDEVIEDLSQYYHNEITAESDLTLIEFVFVGE